MSGRGAGPKGRRFNPARMMAIASKELIQLRRDPRSLALAFVLPAILLVLFGFAITTDVKDIRTAVLDRDNSAESRALVDAFGQSGYFSIRHALTTAGEAEALLLHGEVRMALIIPERFAADLAAGRAASVEVVLDGSDAKTANVAFGYAMAIARNHTDAARVTERRVRPAVEARSRVWYNETLDGRAMVVPGLIAVIMSIISAMLTSLTVAREWERGTMEQLAATPVGRSELILGKLLPYLGIALIDVSIALVGCVVGFDVPFRGSLLLFGVASVVFLAGVLSVGILISVLLKSQLLATQASIFATYMPSLLLSGFFYSLSSMPPFLQLISQLVPARYFVTITRGLFLRGVGLDVVGAPLAGLALFAVAILTVSIRTFRKELA